MRMAILAAATVTLGGCAALNPAPEFYQAQTSAWLAYSQAMQTPMATVALPGGGQVVINRQHVEAPSINPGKGSADVAIEAIHVAPGIANSFSLAATAISAVHSAGDTNINAGGDVSARNVTTNATATSAVTTTTETGSTRTTSGDTITTTDSSNRSTVDRHDSATTDSSNRSTVDSHNSATTDSSTRTASVADDHSNRSTTDNSNHVVSTDDHSNRSTTAPVDSHNSVDSHQVTDSHNATATPTVVYPQVVTP